MSPAIAWHVRSEQSQQALQAARRRWEQVTDITGEYLQRQCAELAYRFLHGLFHFIECRTSRSDLNVMVPIMLAFIFLPNVRR